MATRTCTPSENQANATTAVQSAYHRSFAPLKISIENIVDSIVHFKAKGSQVTFTTSWSTPDVWSGCPTEFGTINGLPSIGDQGVVYVGKSVWDCLPSTVQQYSPGLKWPEEMSARWRRFSSEVLAKLTPRDLAFDTLGLRESSRDTPLDHLPTSPAYDSLPLIVSSVQIEAVIESRSEPFTFELLAKGPPRQVLNLDDVYTTLRIVDEKSPGGKDVRMQILHARLTGTYEATGIRATVDLLDPLLSDAFQVIDFSAGSVAPRLSQRGRSIFGAGFGPEIASRSPRPVPAASVHRGTSVKGLADRDSIVTFLAKPATGSPDIVSDGNIAIEDIKTLLGAQPHAWFEVSSLAEIAQGLSKLQTPPGVIQIIGHGAPGMLALGYYWNPTRYTDDASGPFYLLDSNPYAYGLLAQWIAPSTRVLLVGCYVGSNQPSPMVARGRSLIFDLHDMSGCDVLAADDLVGAASFRNGRFVGSTQGYVRGRWRRSRSLVPALQPALARENRPTFSDVTIRSVPGLGGATRALSSPVPAQVDHYSREISLGAVLAMNELTLHGNVDGQVADLYLICNSRFLKVVSPTPDGPRTRYFATSDDAMFTFDQEDNIFRSLDSANPGTDLWRAARDQLNDQWKSRDLTHTNGTRRGKADAGPSGVPAIAE